MIAARKGITMEKQQKKLKETIKKFHYINLKQKSTLQKKTKTCFKRPVLNIQVETLTCKMQPSKLELLHLLKMKT